MKKICLIFVIALILISFTKVNAQTCTDAGDCQRLIDEYTSQISKLQGQANTLKNQIAQFDAQIKLTTLKIKQTEDQIEMLGGRIDQLEVSLDSLTKAFSSRAVETYKLSKFENNFAFILTASDVSDAVNRFHYLRKIQEEDRSLLTRLQEAQTTYIGEKQDQESLQKQLKTQQANLNSQKFAKNNLLKVTKNDEARYQSLLVQANAQLNRFKNYADTHGGSSLLDNQTKCNEGWTGCYYNQRDSSWGNMFLGLTSYRMKDSGCFVTSVAMLASHYGKNIKPNDIASLQDAFSGGDVNHDFDVNGVHVHIDNVDASSLDAQLSTGKPIMAKLYGGDNQHFIVILRKDGGTYIMNDPFLKDGYNKPLSAGGHNVSNIVGLRLVSFN